MDKIIPYKGNEPYIFISYAHKDGAAVRAVLTRMQKDGYRVWFDEGIDPGTEWDEVIASHVETCGYFLAFVSENYLASENCKDELNYARDLDKKRLLVYLQDVKLPGGMAMRMNRLQSIYKEKYADENDFYKVLYEAEGIDGFASAVPVSSASPTVTPTDASNKGMSFRFLPHEKTGGFAIVGIEGTAYAELVIPESYHGKPVTAIGEDAFRGCESIKTVTLPASVKRIEEAAFRGCTGLAFIDIPDTVKYIDDEAFYGCKGLTYVTIGRGAETIGDWVFAHCASLASIVVDKRNKKYQSKGNCLIEKKAKRLIAGCKNSEIPKDGSVTEIAWSAFAGCVGLASVFIPRSVERIHEEAFLGCTGVCSIGVAKGNKTYHSRFNCLIETKSGTLVLGCAGSAIPGDGSVRKIGFYAFAGCTELPSITVPRPVSQLGSFRDCTALKSIRIADSVTRIGDGAFQNCPALTDIWFDGTVAQWQAVTKWEGWNGGISRAVHCTDGDAV